MDRNLLSFCALSSGPMTYLKIGLIRRTAYLGGKPFILLHENRLIESKEGQKDSAF